MSLRINNGWIECKRWFKGRQKVHLSQISSYEVVRSFFNIPFLEKTIILYTVSGNKIVLKKLARCTVSRLRRRIDRELDRRYQTDTPIKINGFSYTGKADV